MDFIKIYDETYKDLRKYLRKISWKYLDEIEFNEIINKSFFEAYKKIEKKYENTSYKSYIKGFIYNVMRNVVNYKQRYYNKNVELENYNNHSYSHKKGDLSDIIIKKEENDLIYSAINSLDFIEKKTIVLYYFYEYNYKEISIEMNISCHNVRNIISNSLYKMKIYLLNTNYEFDLR